MIWEKLPGESIFDRIVKIGYILKTISKTGSSMAKVEQRCFLLEIFWLTLLLTGCQMQGGLVKSAIAKPDYTIILDDLNEPRGLWQRADGSLCVAETGYKVEMTLPDAGPITLPPGTGSLTCVDANGKRERVVEGLPYAHYGASGVSVGPTDVAELDGALYLLTAEGDDQLSRSLLRIEHSKPPQIVANFLYFATAGQPLEYFLPGEITSNPYAMLPDPANRRFLVTDGATGQLLAVGLDGQIQLYSSVEGHEVLTGMTWGPDGLPYVTSFSQLPHQAGAGAVLSIANGVAHVVLTGLTTPIDLAFDQAGRLYVLEFVYAGETGDPYRNKTGRLVRFLPQGDQWDTGQLLIEGLPYPTALLINANDQLYISINGAFSPPGSGAVVSFSNLTQQQGGEPPIQYGAMNE